VSEAEPAPRRAARIGVQLALSAALLGLTLALVDVSRVLLHLDRLHAGWLLAALGVASLQFVLLAARWWFVARRLGVPLRFSRALAEYHLSTLLNQVLPFGVLGDALRAVRHTRQLEQGSGARVLLAIAVERASGQLALWAVVLAVAPSWWQIAGAKAGGGAVLGALGLCAAAAIAVALGSGRARRWAASLGRLLAAGGRVLFAPSSLAVHLGFSLALVALHGAQFCLAARSLELGLSAGAALRIVPLVLVAATIPGFFGGLGAREAAAAGLYGLMGLDASGGTAISLVYATVGLVASLPGLVVLAGRRAGGG